LDDAALAVQVVAGTLISDEVNAGYGFPSFDDELHAAVALSLLPVQEDGEIMFTRLGLLLLLLKLCFPVKELVADDHSINCVAYFEERQQQCHRILFEFSLRKEIKDRTINVLLICFLDFGQ
jgi:hypothetical protein